MKFQRMCALVLSLTLMFCLLPLTANAADDGSLDLKSSVEQQVSDVGQAIYYAGADNDAAWALAKHGITSRKTLQAGRNHSLTVTLWNSAILQSYVSDSMVELIARSAANGLDKAYLKGSVYWIPGNYYCGTRWHQEADYSDMGTKILDKGYLGQRNSFDDSLEWMAGTVSIKMTVERLKTTKDTVSYRMDVLISDKFDFRGDNGNVSKDLASLFGSFLFREFEWESKMSFTITVPNICNHSSDNYHLIYDPNTLEFTTDVSGMFSANDVTRMPFVYKDGTDQNYYKFEKTVYLLHDDPWVMEYRVINPSKFIMTDYLSGGGPVPILVVPSMEYLVFYAKDFDDAGQIIGWRYYGTRLTAKINSNKTDMFSFLFENQVFDDGSNMIYLTVRNVTQDEIVADRIPLDDQFPNSGGTPGPIDTETSGISGEDILINYLGNMNYFFVMDYFELTVFAKGPEMTSDDYLIHTVTEATCVSEGFVTHTCPDCGYSYNDSQVSALGHDFGEWSITQNATCETKGSEKRTCLVCGQEENRDIVAIGHKWTPATCETAKTCSVCQKTEGEPLGHSFGPWRVVEESSCTAPGHRMRGCPCGAEEFEIVPALDHDFYFSKCKVCGETNEDYLPGDVNCDGKLSYEDALKVLRYSIGLDIMEDKARADINGDGNVNYSDALTILRRSIGLE